MISAPVASRLRLALCLLLPLMSGCESLHYYWQAVQGQWELVDKARPITALLDDPALDATLRHKLMQVNEARHYASESLHLPAGDAYSHYVALDRPAVVWNIVAVPEFSLEAKRWCFPVAGCVKYKGYFNQTDAQSAAQTLQAEGYDVAMGGVAAYSTLGWFDDPVLSTFIFDSDENLQRLILHELAHRQFYVSGDTTLNESWATAVAATGLEGLRGQSTGTPEHLPPDRRFEAVLLRETEDLLEQLKVCYTQFEESPTQYTLEERRSQKRQLIEDYQRQLQAQAAAYADSSRYARWWRDPVNNAHLIAVNNYYRWVDGLRYQLEVVLQGDWQAFYQWSEATLEPLEERERSALLDELNARATPE